VHIDALAREQFVVQRFLKQRVSEDVLALTRDLDQLLRDCFSQLLTEHCVVAAGHRERGTRQTIGATIVATPSVPHVSATLSADAPRETIHATTHENPVYTVDGVIHYGVANMPGGVPRTSTLALTNATLPYVLKLAQQGVTAAVRSDDAIRQGINTYKGAVTYPAVAESQGQKAKDVLELL
jgi:hypothetical protein